jgi:hypothetical protein
MTFFKNIFNYNSKRNDLADLADLAVLINFRSDEVFDKIEQAYILLENKNINNIYFKYYLYYISIYIAGATYIYNLSRSGYFNDSEDYKKVSRVVFELIIFHFHKENISNNKIKGLEEEYWITLGGEIGYFMQIKNNFNKYLEDFKYLKETDKDCYADSYDEEGETYYQIRNYQFVIDIFKYNFIENSEGITLKLNGDNFGWPDDELLEKLIILKDYLKTRLK